MSLRLEILAMPPSPGDFTNKMIGAALEKSILNKAHIHVSNGSLLHIHVSLLPLELHPLMRYSVLNILIGTTLKYATNFSMSSCSEY
jgi:hypothetical protein